MKTRSHVVRAGENLTVIARQFGMSWRELYELPMNEAFRALRPDPNMVRPGDVVAVPAANEAARRLGAYPAPREPLFSVAEYEPYLYAMEATRNRT